MSSSNLISNPAAVDPVRSAGAVGSVPSCGRRTVLQAAGLIALSGGALALAGCTTESGGSSGGQGSGGSSTPAAGGSAAAVTVAAADVPVGGGVIVEQKYVVTQPAAGEFKGFSATCTHQGCTVGSVANGNIVCPCHGSEFDITTGNPTHGPAQKPLPAVVVKKSGSSVVIEG